MCGVAAVLLQDPRGDTGPALARLASAMQHRGPDGHGVQYADGRSAGVAHRRLSILDLVGGAQPMGNEAGTLHVAFNGEIYNFEALRRELEHAGHRFVSRADTEVVVHGWEEWGEALLPRLNGIFAFAVLDARDAQGGATLHLARDPVGAKPLYVGRFAGGWWAASELQAARCAGVAGPELSTEAVAEFLVYRFIPAPLTPFAGAWKLPPGTTVALRRGSDAQHPVFRTYAYAGASPARPATDTEWADALRGALARAVPRQLMSDVPVGSLLSGGVDSTVITALMTAASGGTAPQCFAVGFAEAPDGGELVQARRAAAALGAPLTEIAVDESGYIDAWRRQVSGSGEPIANSGVVLLGLLCQSVSRTHKVVLSGQGADEPLGGYPRHAAERLQGLASRLLPLLDRLPVGTLAGDRVERLRRLGTHRDEARRFTETLAVFGAEEAAHLVRVPVDPDRLAAPMRRALDATEGDDHLNRFLMADARLSLADDLLMVADQMSMAHSVELRVPFLDLDLLALVSRMPSRLKVSRLAERKWFYRRAVAPLLPNELRRPLLGPRARLGRKLGFTTPLDRWFADWAERKAERELLGPHALTPAILDAAGIRRLVDAARQHGRPRARQLMSLFVLESWLRGLDRGTDAGRDAAIPAA